MHGPHPGIIPLRDLAPGGFLCFFVLLRDRLPEGHSHHDTQDVIMHESPLLVAIPLLGVFLFWFCLFLLWVFCLFACLLLLFGLCFWFSCWEPVASLQIQ